MDLSLSDDQQLLQTTARSLLAARSPRAALAMQELDPTADDPALWAEMASLGWLGLALAPERGGSGGRLVDVALLCEELGHNLNPLPYLAVAVAAAAALEHAGAPPAPDLLADLAAGRRRPVLAVAEADGRWHPDAVATTWDGSRVRGTKAYVQNAGTADVLLVAARGADGVDLVAVERDQSGVDLTPLPTMAGLAWYDVALDAAATSLGAGWHAVDAALTRAGAMQAAWCAGAADQLLAETVEYATERHQFGVPIGSFQAVQHRLADCGIAVAEAQTLARLAAFQLDARKPSARRLASTAFVRATRAFTSVARSCHQVWGGIGFCTETDVHLFSRRAKVAEQQWGGPDHHLEVVAEELATASLLRDRYVQRHPALAQR